MPLKETSVKEQCFKQLAKFSHGVNKLKICALAEDNRSLITTCPIKEGEDVLFIPSDNLISVERIKTEYPNSLAAKIHTSSSFAKELYKT